MKAGDLVKIEFPDDDPVAGLYIKDDIVVYGITTRALVLWEGQIYSAPLEQIEIISEVN